MRIRICYLYCGFNDLLYVCFRSQYHERNRFPEDVESPAAVYCTARILTCILTGHTIITHTYICILKSLMQAYLHGRPLVPVK